MMITTQQTLFLIVLTGSLVLFALGRFRVDVVAMLTLLALVVTGLVPAQDALAGFASEPAIIVASVFVLSAALAATGVSDKIGRFVAAAAGEREWRAILVIMPSVALLAAFSHHVMVTAMMLPILMRIARERSIPASRLLMPMSLAASLGTCLTLFSAPAFLLASELLERQAGNGLGVFSITPIGIILLVVALIYATAMRWLIPRRTGADDNASYLQLDRYYTEIALQEESDWIGRSVADFTRHFGERLEVVDWLRGGQRVESGQAPLAQGDVLLVRADPDELSSLKNESGLVLHAVAKYGAASSADEADRPLVQAIVAPNSQFVGRTIGSIDFLRTLGVIVVGLWRKEGWIGTELSAVTLHDGDLLVLSGDRDRYTELAQHRGFLLMMPFAATTRWRRRAPLAIGVCLAAVATAATGIVPAAFAFLTGAVAVVALRCVDVEHAYRNIDVRIFVMIAGVIPLGAAMQSSGTADLAAAQIVAISNDWAPLAVLALLFVAAALVTQLLSDAATTVLLVPIAISVAQSLGLAAAPFVVCTALGAVTAFLTPLGHHGNLLILRAGGFRFGDFVRVGLPLTLLLGAASCWAAQALWLDGPWLPPVIAEWARARL